MIRKSIKTFFLGFFMFLFLSCIMNPEYLKKDYSIINYSDKTVLFSLPDYGNEIYTLSKNEKIIKSIYAQPRLEFTSDFRTTYSEISETETVIKNRTSWDLKIINKSGSNVVVREKNNNMGYFDDTGNMQPIQITNNNTENEKLFSQSPSFIVLFSPEKEYPPSFEVIKKDDVFLLLIKP